MGNSVYKAVDLGAVCLAVFLTASFSYAQTRFSFGRGSDHFVHVFLTRILRQNRRRLLVRVPDLINESDFGAYPLFLHWFLSLIPEQWLKIVALIFNSAANVVLVSATYWLSSRHLPPPLPGLASLFVALTPQFFFALSARIYGISSRPVGIILFNLWLFACGAATAGSHSRAGALVATGLAFVIWGGNTFAQQSSLLFSALFLAIFGEWIPLASTLAGALLLAAAFPAYTGAYLRATWRFYRAYASELAAVFVLRQRYSIWMDVIVDFWRRGDRTVYRHLVYVYSSPLIITVFMNPFVTLGAYSMASGVSSDWIVATGQRSGLAAVVLFVATSFRPTRFLGEPERYIELATMPATIAGCTYLWSQGATLLLGAFLLWFAFLNVLQVLMVRRKARQSPDAPTLSPIADLINAEFQGYEVRFGCNNEELTKRLMAYPWKFAKHWSIGKKYANMSVKEAFSEFPALRKPAFERVVRVYGLNTILLDKSVFCDVFEDAPEWRSRLRVLADDSRYRLYRIIA